MFYHNALQISENSEGEAGIWTGYFFFGDKKRGNQEQISKNLQEVIYFYSKELWIYEKGPAWDGFVRSQWRWMNNLYILIYDTYIYIYIYTKVFWLYLCALSLSLLFSLLKPMNSLKVVMMVSGVRFWGFQLYPCDRRVRSTETPTSANCLCCWPFGVSENSTKSHQKNREM